MSLPLTIAVVQPPTKCGDLAHNITAHCDAVTRAQSRLVVFPELSLTGYAMDAAPVDDFRALLPLQQACSPTNTIALVGAPTTIGSGNSVAISFVVVSGAGVEVVYHKMCLSPAEQKRYVPGTAPAKIEIDGWDIGLGICKDTGSDEQVGATVALGIHLYVAGLVHDSDEIDELSLRAQRVVSAGAIPVAFANAAGDVGPAYPTAGGASAIWGHRGDVLEQADGTPGAIAISTIERFD